MSWEKKIAEAYGEEYILRQLAEECAELCQASLKLVRAMHGETPLSVLEAKEHLLEEMADVEVMMCLADKAMLSDAARMHMNAVYCFKQQRMIERLLGEKKCRGE